MARPGLLAVARKVKSSARSALAARRMRRPSHADVAGFALEVPGRFRWHYVDHDFEPLSRQFLESHVRAGARVADVGAHIGWYSLLLARAVGPEGRVLAVEPAEENLRYLRRNIAANGFDDRVEVLPAAATDFTGVAEFHITGSSDNHGLHRHPNTETERLIQVRTVRLDEVVDGVDFVKVDTEGAEIATLEGLSEALTADGARGALVEWAPMCQEIAGYAPTALLDKLSGMGYELSVLDDRAQVVRRVDDVLRGLESGELPNDWYGNLACTKSQ